MFRKDIEPRCQYCVHGRTLDEQYVSCEKKGVVTAGWHCRKFSYDPLKRVPPRPAPLKKPLDSSRFSLD